MIKRATVSAGGLQRLTSEEHERGLEMANISAKNGARPDKLYGGRAVLLTDN